WVGRCGLTAELSSNGRIANQLIQALGGLRNARILANGDLLKLLHKMAHGDVEIEIEPESPNKPKRQVRAYAIPRAQALEVLSKSRGSAEIAKNLLASLLYFKAFVLGMRLQCPECRQTTWYRLPDMNHTLICE